MKRVIIIVLLILTILLGYGLVVKGFSINGTPISVPSYSDIEEQSNVLTLAVAAYNKKNNTEYQTILSNLKSSITKYEDAKEQYEDLIAEIGTSEITEEEDEIRTVSSLGVYEIDFLWATIGNYAKKEGLTITMNVNKSTASTESLGYGLYNLSFSVSGQYIDIADFLYDIEDDDELAFEIRDYSMTSGKATFTVYNVPLNSDTLIETITIESEDEDGTETEENTNTVGTENVTSNTTNSTSNNTNSTATTNTTVTNTVSTSSSSSATIGEQNALSKAKSYLNSSAFSYNGLIAQLEYEGYSTSEATYGADNCGANWNEQAVKKAKSYLNSSAFSRVGLISQLEYEKFTTSEATYGADNCGADWNEQAAEKAKSYLNSSAFSRDGLISQLVYEGFTTSEAEYGVSAVGY